MPRAVGIWIVKKGNFVLAAFTVKHEFVTWLKMNVNKHKWQSHEILIIKCIDGSPDSMKKYFSIEDFING